MTKPVTGKAEVALEYPDKLYIGTFERSSRFEAHLDPTGIALIGLVIVVLVDYSAVTKLD